MKKFAFLLMAILISMVAHPQGNINMHDTVVKRDGIEIVGKILEVTPSYIVCQISDSLEVINQVILMDDIFMLKYANGTKEVIKGSLDVSRNALIMDKVKYQNKVTSYRKMKTAGAVMLAIGAVFTGVGISKLSNSIDSFSEPNLLLLGVPLCGAGIPLSIVGSRKVEQYQRKLNTISLGLNLSPNQQGVALTYKF